MNLALLTTAASSGAWIIDLVPIDEEGVDGEDDIFDQVRTRLRRRGTANVAPVEPAIKSTLSNCRKGRIREYGPSIKTPSCGLFPSLMLAAEEKEGSIRAVFSACLRKRRVAPFFSSTTIQIVAG